MSPVQFVTIVGPDGAIYPPAGVALPTGEVEVEVRPRLRGELNERLRQLCVHRGLSWDHLSSEDRRRLEEDLEQADNGLPPVRPAPGLFQGSILYMAPDIDAPLDEMKEYME